MVNRKGPIFGHHIIQYVPKDHSKGMINYFITNIINVSCVVSFITFKKICDI